MKLTGFILLFALGGSISVAAITLLPDLSPYTHGLLMPLELIAVTVPDTNNFFNTVELSSVLQPSTFNALRDVYFLLFTQRNREIGQNITSNLNSIRNSNFDRLKPTRFIIHGWLNDFSSPVNTEITAGYLNRGDYNVIVVDWSRASKNYNYIQASREVGNVGGAVAKLVDFLVLNAFSSYDTLVVIGHSLGAHAAGFTGKHVQFGTIKTIVGLDPAGPFFSKNDATNRLTSNDALYVEAIHTDGYRLGLLDPIGDADFYPHYGILQPGCELDVTGICGHLRAHTYYAESLSADDRFIAVKCGSYTQIQSLNCQPTANGTKMGGDLPNFGLTGVYYLDVNNASPFAQGP